MYVKIEIDLNPHEQYVLRRLCLLYHYLKYNNDQFNEYNESMVFFFALFLWNSWEVDAAFFNVVDDDELTLIGGECDLLDVPVEWGTLNCNRIFQFLQIKNLTTNTFISSQFIYLHYVLLGDDQHCLIYFWIRMH